LKLEKSAVLIYPDSRLRTVSQVVTTFDTSLTNLVAELDHHLHSGPPSVGIAAPQIGRFFRVVIVDVSAMFDAGRKRKPKGTNHGRLVLINPVIAERSGEVVGREGCLSVPDYTGNVARADAITLVAQDHSGEQRKFKLSGFEARAAQHEVDHLDGILFLDRVVSPRQVFRRKNYK
jgi:peptide deformylase